MIDKLVYDYIELPCQVYHIVGSDSLTLIRQWSVLTNVMKLNGILYLLLYLYQTLRVVKAFSWTVLDVHNLLFVE